MVSDFGMSRIKDQDATYAKTCSTIGSVRWMAPEAIQKKHYSEKSDSYSFGVLMVRAPPFFERPCVQNIFV